MKHVLIAALVLGMAVPAMAVLGLPIADDGQSEPGMMQVSGGATIESDMNLYGARFTYGINHDASVFAGGGLFSPKHGDSEPFFQVGGIYSLKNLAAELPFDLAARLAVGLMSMSDSYSSPWESWKFDTDVMTINIGLLGSKPIEMVTVYGLLGISHQRYSWKGTYTVPGWGSESASDTDTENEITIAAGVLYPMNENLSFYGELALIDELFISIGARYRFVK